MSVMVLRFLAASSRGGDHTSIGDLLELVILSPPMFGGQHALFGPSCR